MKQIPNKVKIDKDHPLTNLDEQLKHELDTFQERIHAEIWGDVTNVLFGSHIFLTAPQILHLCHLAHTNALHTLEDLENNFHWNWMPDYSHQLLELIHCVSNYKLHVSAFIPVEDGISTSKSSLNHSQPDAGKLDNQSSSKASRQKVKKGLGNQHCGACGVLGHNSKFCRHIYGHPSPNLIIQESNPHCPKMTINTILKIPEPNVPSL